jgi:hypothetical protein
MFRRLPALGLPAKLCGALVAVSAVDYAETTQHHRTSREFWPQGVEEAYFERLNTGDVVYFSRSRWQYHPAKAVAVRLAKW